MSTVETSNREPPLGVKDLEAWVEDLSKEPPLPEGGLLRGEVLGISGDGRRGQLRGPGRATVEILLEEPISAKRGDNVEVSGAPELVAEAVPVGLRLVWKGAAAKNHGTSSRFRARRASVEAQAAKLPFTTPRIDARLRYDGRVRLVTERHSKAWVDLDEAGRQYRWLKPDPLYCEDMRDPAALAATLASALPLVNASDVVLIAGGGSELAALDVLEDERVVGALVRLTARCPTILAVEHAGDELLTNKVVTYPVDSARAAIHLILVESGEPAGEPPRPARHEPELADDRGASAPRSVPLLPRVLLRLLVLGAAASLGWWARGLGTDGAQPDGQAVGAPSSAATSAAR